MKELALVLRRPKFKASEDEIQRIIVTLMQTAEVVTSKLRAVKEDPKDNMVIETANDGKADVIVSGDNHLLALEDFREKGFFSTDEVILYW